jgi:putative mRNA 3-end processing factor
MVVKGFNHKVSITKTRGILLGRYVACDGTTIDRPIAVISHAHGDHTEEFESALASCDAVLMTPATKDLLIADRGNWLLRRRNLIGLPYQKPFTYKDETITLYPATHMLGSCQVLFENKDRTRTVYTGDFNYPNTPVIEADILVVEATYGDPHDIRTHDRKYLINKLVSLIEDELKRQKPVYVFSYPGKIQSLMNILNNAGVNIPFLATRKDIKMAEIYNKYGMNTGNILDIGTKEAYNIQKGTQPFISFHRIGSIVPEAEKCLTIRASAVMAKEDFYQPRKNYYVVALSDHADFNGLFEYVKKSGAKLVIADSSRCGKAEVLTREIKKRLGVDAKPLPS